MSTLFGLYIAEGACRPVLATQIIMSCSIYLFCCGFFLKIFEFRIFFKHFEFRRGIELTGLKDYTDILHMNWKSFESFNLAVTETVNQHFNVVNIWL